MARKPRLQFEGAIYHITFRGNAKMNIFIDDADRIRLKERIAESAEDFHVRVYLYCLMSNHVHLLVETPSGNLSRFMGSVLTGYTVYFNRRHQRVGHLFQGRYGAQIVEGNEYLLKLSRYIHLNPVCVPDRTESSLQDRVQALRNYVWSSYRGYAGITGMEEWVQNMPLLEMISHHKIRPEIAYQRYVESGLARTDEEFLQCIKNSPWGIGTDKFQQKIRSKYGELAGKRVKEEDVTLRRKLKTVPAKIVFDVLSKYGLTNDTIAVRCRNSFDRAITAYMLIRQAGWTQRQAAEKLGLRSGSTVSHQIRRLKEKYHKDKRCHKRLDKIERSIVNRYFKG
jgi:putative transposase